ncbi:MAG: TonB-dependent receptor [Bacteroidota bacterium]
MPSTLSAQNAIDCEIELRGQVMETDHGKPLAFARIFIKELDRGVLTDSVGRYQIDHLCPGTYTLVCTHEQCNHTEEQHELNHQHAHVDFTLENLSISLDEVSIIETRRDEETQANVVVAGIDLVKKQGQNLGEALATLPGVQTLKTGATIAKPVIHGLHSNRVVILNNGIRQEAQQWGSEHAPEIDPFIATQLKVIKGAAGVQYGSGAVAGVILVEPAPLRDSAGVGGKLHLQGFSNGRQGVVSGFLEGNVGKLPPLSWRLQGTLKRGGNLHTPDYFLENTSVAEKNFSAAVAWKELDRGVEIYYSRFDTQIGILFPAHVGGASDFQRALEATQPIGSDTVGFSYGFRRPYQDIQHHLAKGKAYWHLPNVGKLNLVYAYQFNRRREFDKHKPRGRDENGEDKAELDFRINTHTLEGSWEHLPVNGFSGRIGAFGIYQNNSLSGRPFIPNFVNIGGEFFAIERWKQGKWEIEAGARYDYRWVNSAREEAGIDIFSVRAFQNVSGSVGAIYRISPSLQLNANLGTAWRPPHVNELFSDGLHHGAATVEKGDSTLGAEQGIKGIISLSYAGQNGLSAEISVYRHHFWNFIYRRPGGLERTIRGTFPVLQYAETRARLQGADLSLQYNAPFGLTVGLKASYLDAYNITDDEPLIFMPPNSIEGSLGFQGNNGIKPWLKVSVRHVAEQKNIPFSEIPEERDWLPPPPAYTLVGLDAGAEVRLGAQSLQVGASAENLFNVLYRDYLNRFRYYADEIGRNFSIRLTFTF